MRRPPLLLHVLVSLALLLNGIGSAQASVRMLMAQPAAASHHAGQAGSAHEPQHPSHHSGAAAIDAHPALTALPDKSGSHSDCCKSASCHCGCVNHVQLGWTATALVLANITHGSPTPALSLGHAAAALPHLIRPPISQA